MRATEWQCWVGRAAFLVHFTVLVALRYFWKRRRFFLLFYTWLSDVNYVSLLTFECLLCLFSMTVRCNAQKEWFFCYFFPRGWALVLIGSVSSAHVY